jgi:hypothetical protein
MRAHPTQVTEMPYASYRAADPVGHLKKRRLELRIRHRDDATLVGVDEDTYWA